MKQIASFTVDHDTLTPGIYISRRDGTIITYDLRTRTPNAGSYMDNRTMHSVEHMFATCIRNHPVVGSHVVYFGPMGCQTGFYLLVDTCTPETVLSAVIDVLQEILRYDGPVYGAERKNCGNYRNLSLLDAKIECARYLDVLRHTVNDFTYPGAPATEGEYV